MSTKFDFSKWMKDTKKEKYVYKGKKNKSDFPMLIDLLKKDQRELKLFLKTQLEYFYKKEDIVYKDGFLYAKGIEPICLVAHMDTTPTVGGAKRVPVIDFYEDVTKDEDGNVKHTLSSPQGIGGDDRCGVWVILSILKETKFRPTILFCEDEEIGCIGSEKFTKTEYINDFSDLKFLVQIDRRGSDDIVFYEDINQDFHDWVANVTGYTEKIGSCTDIVNLSQACMISSVNLSSGYYNEHTLEEEIVVEETLRTKDVVIKLLEEGTKEEVGQFEYVERKYPTYNNYYSSYYQSIYGDDYDDDDGWPGYNYYGSTKDVTDNTKNIECGFRGYFVYEDIHGEYVEVYVDGDSKYSCIAKFLMEHVEVCWADVLDYSFEELD